MALAGKLGDYADKTFAQYDSTFNPMQTRLMGMATQELSPQYQQQKAGQAIAGAAQLGEANRNNALRDLTSFGVGDPSNVGRRYSIDAGMRNQTAATEAGAANEAMISARNEGRTDQNQAIANEQANAARAVALDQAAMSLKYPTLGSNSQSTQASQSQNHSQGAPPTDKSGNQNPNSSTSSGAGFDPTHGAGIGGSGAMTIDNPFFGGAGTAGSGLQDAANMVLDGSGDFPLTDPAAGGVSGDPFANLGYGNYNSGATDTGGVYDPNASYNSYDSGSGYGSGPDQTYSSPDYSAFDNSGGGFDYSGDYSGDANYAQGGGVLPLQGGGPAPVSASPSRGAKTDDIKAKVDANEFVIPQDVAVFKGHEHFYKLMEKSRQTRMEYQRGIHKPAGSK
jgi:hypothetical protein